MGILDFGQVDAMDGKAMGTAIAQVTVSENGRAKVGSYSVGRDCRKLTALDGPILMARESCGPFSMERDIKN
ncbi:MAG: hypothetical protein ACREV2_15100 [Burkholderiales bacterium]